MGERGTEEELKRLQDEKVGKKSKDRKSEGRKKSSGINRKSPGELEADGYGRLCPMTHSLFMTHE